MNRTWQEMELTTKAHTFSGYQYSTTQWTLSAVTDHCGKYYRCHAIAASSSVLCVCHIHNHLFTTSTATTHPHICALYCAFSRWVRLKKMVWKQTLFCRTFCPVRRFVSYVVLSHRTFFRGTFCPKGYFDSLDVLYCGMFCPWDVLSVGLFSVHLILNPNTKYKK